MLGAHSQYLKRKASFIRNLFLFGSATVALFMVAGQAQAQWKAYNDHSPGAGTSPNATTLVCHQAGSTNLHNIADGTDIPGVTMTISIEGTAPGTGSTAGVPDADTPLYNEFNNFVFFGTSTGPNSCIQIRQAGTVHYTFSGLDPSKTYKFKGGAVRGNPTDTQNSTRVYTNRWTKADIAGADAATANHQQGAGSRWGYMDATRFPAALSGTQVAINTGVCTNGDMFAWDAINPGADGAFEITCTQFYYAGSVPTGFGTDSQECWPNSGDYGYSISGLSLEEYSSCATMSVTVAPLDQSVPECANATIIANICGGVAPYTIAWYHGADVIPDATSSILVLSNVHPATHDGTYSVLVMDSTPGSPQIAFSDPAATNTVIPDVGGPVMLAAVSQIDGRTVNAYFSKTVTLASSTGGGFLLRPVGGGADIGFDSSTNINSTNVSLHTTSPIEPKNYDLLVQGSSSVLGCSANVPDGASVPLAQYILVFGTQLNNEWQWHDATNDLGTAWLDNAYDDRGDHWKTGNALLDGKTAQPPGRPFITNAAAASFELVNTQLPLTNDAFLTTSAVIPLYYFKKHFTLPVASADIASLRIRTMFDDWGIVYLNGQEGYRSPQFRPDLEEPWNKYATNGVVGDAWWSASLAFPKTNLYATGNIMAVKLKEGSAGSSDITMGLELTALVTNFPPVGPTLTIIDNGDGTVTITWSGGGTLWASTDLINWLDTGLTSPATINKSLPYRFFRARQ